MASDFAHMNIFFIVTTVVVIIIGILLAIALYKLVDILRDVKHVSKNISEESDNVRGDVAELRSKVRKEGMKASSFVAVLKRMLGQWWKPSKKRRHPEE